MESVDIGLEQDKDSPKESSVEEVRIESSYKEFTPAKGITKPNVLNLFFPGWSMGESVKSALELNQAFADISGARTLVATTRPETVIPDSLLREAESQIPTIKEQIEMYGIEEVTIGGHSEGASKAANLIWLLSGKPDADGKPTEKPIVKVRGGIFLDPVGLYEQGSGELAGKFAKDSMLDTLPNNLVDQSRIVPSGNRLFRFPKRVVGLIKRGKNTVAAGNDIVLGAIKEAKLSGKDYPERFVSQVQEMAKENPRFRTLNVPIILITGAKDPVSDWEKVISPEAEDRMFEEFLNQPPEEEQKTLVGIQEEQLRKTNFPNSPYIRMVVPDKFGNHGLPLFRSKSVANVGLGLIDRFYGQHRNTPPK